MLLLSSEVSAMSTVLLCCPSRYRRSRNILSKTCQNGVIIQVVYDGRHYFFVRLPFKWPSTVLKSSYESSLLQTKFFYLCSPFAFSISVLFHF